MKYSHYSFGKWTQIFGCDACTETNAKDEMKGLQAYFDKHKGIAGLVLTDLIPSVVSIPIPVELFYKQLYKNYGLYSKMYLHRTCT